MKIPLDRVGGVPLGFFDAGSQIAPDAKRFLKKLRMGICDLLSSKLGLPSPAIVTPVWLAPIIQKSPSRMLRIERSRTLVSKNAAHMMQCGFLATKFDSDGTSASSKPVSGPPHGRTYLRRLQFSSRSDLSVILRS
jgi:hypothetical protein